MSVSSGSFRESGIYENETQRL
jgi:hypothetical protein